MGKGGRKNLFLKKSLFSPAVDPDPMERSDKKLCFEKQFSPFLSV
jgi:hypothetical protein